MKFNSLILLLAIIIGFNNCKKSEQKPAPVNCNGLITDTTGTGDTAKVFVPTAFSPDNNGKNDAFSPVGIAISSWDIKVFDENNTIVFTSQSNLNRWIPTAAPNAFKKYYYRVQATTSSNHRIGVCGDLYLINCLPINADMSLYKFESQLTQTGFDLSLPNEEASANCN